jgi:hypothetical protein
MSSTSRKLTIAAGSIAIVVASFFGTLFVLDYAIFTPDYIRARDIKIFKVALENYRAAKGHYPGPSAGIPLSDLKKELVGGGFITDIPRDPSNVAYTYASDGASSYVLVLRLDVVPNVPPANGNCITGVGLPATTVQPRCPF